MASALLLQPSCDDCTPRPNTVQLACLDAVAGRVLRLGPGAVVSAFDVPLGHLAFDDAWCRALASGGVESTDESVEEVQPAGAVAAVLVRGERRPGGRGFVW